MGLIHQSLMAALFYPLNGTISMPFKNNIKVMNIVQNAPPTRLFIDSRWWGTGTDREMKTVSTLWKTC